MKIRIIEGNGPKGWAIEHGEGRYYYHDEVTVPDEVGTLFCAHGLAEDVSGRVPTLARPSQGDTVLVPESARTVHRAE